MNLVGLIVSIVAFLVLSIIFYFNNMRKVAILTNKKKKRKPKDVVITEVKYLSIKYNLNKEKLYNRKIILTVAILNSFIITVVSCVIIVIPWHIAFQLMVGFVLLLGLIYSLYGILGSILKKRGYSNE